MKRYHDSSYSIKAQHRLLGLGSLLWVVSAWACPLLHHRHCTEPACSFVSPCTRTSLRTARMYFFFPASPALSSSAAWVPGQVLRAGDRWGAVAGCCLFSPLSYFLIPCPCWSPLQSPRKWVKPFTCPTFEANANSRPWWMYLFALREKAWQAEVWVICAHVVAESFQETTLPA